MKDIRQLGAAANRATTKKKKKAPTKAPPKSSVRVAVDADTLARWQDAAASDGRTLSSFVRLAVDRALANAQRRRYAHAQLADPAVDPRQLVLFLLDEHTRTP